MNGTLRAPPPVGNRQSDLITLLQVLLILQVVAGHLALIAFPEFRLLDPDRPADLLVMVWRMAGRFGGQAAIVFIGLSGYFLVPRLIAIGLRTPESGGPVPFLAARLRRIYPTLAFAMLLTWACDLAGQSFDGAAPLYRANLGYDTAEARTLPVAVANLLSLQPTFAPSFGSNGPLWTLGYIVQFYVAGTAIAAASRFAPGGRPILAAALVLLPLLGAAAVWKPQWAILFIAWIGCAGLRWLRTPRALPGVAAACGAIGLMVLANRTGNLLVSTALSGGSAMLFSIAVAADFRSLEQWRLPGWLRSLAQANFQVYAFHFPIAVASFAAALGWFDTASLAFRLAYPLVVAAATLAIAMPFARWADRMRKPA